MDIKLLLLCVGLCGCTTKDIHSGYVNKNHIYDVPSFTSIATNNRYFTSIVIKNNKTFGNKEFKSTSECRNENNTSCGSFVSALKKID